MTTYDCYAIFNRKFASSYDSRNGVAVPYDHEADTFNTRDETLLEPAANRTAAPVAVSASGDRIYIHAEATTTRGYVQALNTSDGSVEKTFPVDHETVYNAYGNLCVAEQGAALYATYGPGCLYRIDISGEKWTAARVPNTDAPWGGLQDIAASLPGENLFMSVDFYWQSEGQYYHDIGEVDLTNKYQSTILHTIEPRVSGSRIAAAQTGPGLQVFTVSGNPAGYGGQEPVRFTVVDVETQRAVYSKDMTEPGPQKDFSSFGLAVSSDGKEVYITGADLTGKKNYTYLWVYDTAKKKMKPNRLELGLNTGYDWHVSAAPAGIDKLYVSGTDTKGYTIVNTKTLEIEDTTEAPYFGPMFGFYPAQDNS